MRKMFARRLNRARTAGALLGLGFCLTALSAAEAVEVALPITVEKVWFRPGRQTGMAKLKLKQLSGQLTIDDAGLEIVGKKDSVYIPVDSISMVSLGKLGTDVDTEWIVLQLQGAEGNRTVAIRDGHALGYGQKTRELFRTVRDVMKSLSTAQYRVDPGYKVFDQISFQMTLAIPDNWSHFIHSGVTIGDRLAQGTIIFSAEPIDRMADRDETLESVMHGKIVANAVFRTDVPEQGLFFTKLQIEGTDLLTGQPKILEVKYIGGFISPTEGAFNSEAPHADDVKVGNEVVIFTYFEENLGNGVSGHAIYALHGGLYRVVNTSRNGKIVLGRGEGYAVSRNWKLEELGARVVELKR